MQPFAAETTGMVAVVGARGATTSGGTAMTDGPWLGDACSLVDAFRAGDRSPVEELDATLAAIDDSELNAFSFLDPDLARAKAAEADTDLPFGGVPFGVKELSPYAGWPNTEATLVFADRVADYTETALVRAEQLGGVVPVGLTTASEFGGLNVSVSKLNGVTHNPWQHGRTAGGSSSGSSAAVAGGLLTLASGGDGGGSIRIPAGFYGLPGMKGTAVVNPTVADMVTEAGELLAAEVGLQVVDLDLAFPGLGFEWALGNLAGLYADLDGLWPECKDELSGEIAFGLTIAEQKYSIDMMARSERARTRANEAVAAAFDEVDFIISATNPDVAFAADTFLNLETAGQPTGPENNGALTIPYNIVGNPSLSVPIGQLNGLPVGMQIATRHHDDALVLDLGLALERERPWPLVAPAAPC